MSTNGHEGIWETDFSIDYKHLNFEGEVAEGAFGKIFKGDYFGTPVAIKKFIESGYAEDDQKYIAREVATLKGIRHPCIVNFMGVCMHSSGVYIVTEWIPNGDLTNLLKNVSVDIAWKERTQMLMDAAVAMRYLHAHGIIHRDLKSENLLLTENGRVKVCDLGFARTTKKLTRCMSVAGTELYMAPEVMLGEDYDEKCDVFSFGIVVFEVVCRHPPPKRSLETKYGFPSGLLTQYMPPDCPPDLALLVMECTHYEKEGRPSFEDIFRSLKELFDELEAEEAATFVSDNQARARIEQERQARLEREQAEREQREQEEKDRREQEERDRKARAVKEKREKELREREKQKKKHEQQQQKQAEDVERREQDEASAKERESQLRAQLEREVMEKLEQEKRAIREQLEQEYAQKEREREERERKERAEREEREREEREERDRRARDEAVLALASPRSRGASSSSSSGVSITVSKLDSGSSGTEQQQQQQPGKKERARSWALRGPRKSGLKQALKEESAKASGQGGQLGSQSSETLGQAKSAEADATAKVKKAAAAKEAKERRRSWAPMRLLEEKEKKEKKKKAKEEKRKKEEEEKNKKKEEKKKKKIEKKIKDEEKKVENDKKHARTRSGSMAAVISGSNHVVVAEHELESSP